MDTTGTRTTAPPPVTRVEIRSIEYVPVAERHGKVSHLGPLWFAGNAQLAWSKDRGATWEWSEDWRFGDRFGCPTFLNFGRNYAGARDEFVYLYSPDARSAYDPR